MVSNKILFLSTFCCIASAFFLKNIFCKPISIARIRLESSAFKNNQAIPQKYTCESKENYSPPLSWKRIPQQAKSLVIICEDPDAPRGTFVHWFIYNIPTNISSLPQNIKEGEDVSAIPGVKQGANDFGKHGWNGPCPPHGTHRYIFRIYALDVKNLNKIPEKALTKDAFLNMYGDNVLGYGELTGLYTKAGEKQTEVTTSIPKKAKKKAPQPFVKKQEAVNTCGY